MNRYVQRKTVVLVSWTIVNVNGGVLLADHEPVALLLALSACAGILWLIFETFNHICDPRQNELIEIIEDKYPVTYKAVRALRRKKHTPANLSYLHEIIADLRDVYPLRHSTLERLIWVTVRYLFLIANFSVITYAGMRLKMPIEFHDLSISSPFIRHFYYHLVSIATVGYGDIHPSGLGDLSYWIVVLELLVTFLFVLKLVTFFQGAARLTIDNVTIALRSFFMERVELGGDSGRKG